MEERSTDDQIKLNGFIISAYLMHIDCNRSAIGSEMNGIYRDCTMWELHTAKIMNRTLIAVCLSCYSAHRNCFSCGINLKLNWLRGKFILFISEHKQQCSDLHPNKIIILPLEHTMEQHNREQHKQHDASSSNNNNSNELNQNRHNLHSSNAIADIPIIINRLQSNMRLRCVRPTFWFRLLRLLLFASFLNYYISLK